MASNRATSIARRPLRPAAQLSLPLGGDLPASCASWEALRGTPKSAVSGHVLGVPSRDWGGDSDGVASIHGRPWRPGAARYRVTSVDRLTGVQDQRDASGWCLACIYMLQALRAGRVGVEVVVLP